MNASLKKTLTVQGHRHLLKLPHLPPHCSRCGEMHGTDFLGEDGDGSLYRSLLNVSWGVDMWKSVRVSCCQASDCHSRAKCQRELEHSEPLVRMGMNVGRRSSTRKDRERRSQLVENQKCAKFKPFFFST